MKSRLDSELNDPESLDLIGTPPPKIPSPIFTDIPANLFETIHQLKEALTLLAYQQEQILREHYRPAVRRLCQQKRDNALTSNM